MCTNLRRLQDNGPWLTTKYKSTFFILDFSLDILDAVGRLHLKGDSLARQGLHEDLHGSLRSWKSKEIVSYYNVDILVIEYNKDSFEVMPCTWQKSTAQDYSFY